MPMDVEPFRAQIERIQALALPFLKRGGDDAVIIAAMRHFNELLQQGNVEAADKTLEDMLRVLKE